MTRSPRVSRKHKTNRRRPFHRIEQGVIQSESLEDRRLLTVLLADSFEVGEWNGVWAEDGQNDWKRSTQRESEGSYSAEVDGYASNATLSLANPIDLTTYESAELTFSWYIESGFDSGEYIALDFFDGTNWNQIASLDGNVDQENTWHNETITIDGSYLTSDFQLRFRAKVSSSREDGFVDNVKIEGTAPSSKLAISDAQVLEGDSGSSNLVFTVARTGDVAQSTSVDFATSDVTATDGTDYVGQNGTLFFAAGDAAPQTISIPITGDVSPEADEAFLLDLSNPMGASITDGQGRGTILDDDAVPTISFSDFSDTTGLELVGDALIEGGDTLRLTSAAVGQEGAAWYTAEKPFVSVDWETSFDFNLNENFGDVGGSDGFTFIIQNHAPTFLSGGGGTLGYAALPNSVVVEFDTYQNIATETIDSDPSQSHISVHTGGTGPNFSNESYSLGAYSTPSIMDDAATHAVKISYTPGMLLIYFDNPLAPVLQVPIDLDQTLDLDGGKAWVGFTATTGGGYQNHDILNWDFRVLADTDTTVSVDNVEGLEGDSGTTDLVFTVERQGDNSGSTTVDWSTANGTATAGNDYVIGSGQVSFGVGETEKLVEITVNGDNVEEAHETFLISLSNAVGGIIVDDSAVGTVLNDDSTLSIGNATATEGDSSLRFLGEFVTENSGGLQTPRLLTFGPDGNADGVDDLYVASAATNEILLYDGVTGDFLRPFVTGVDAPPDPIGLKFSPSDGHLYVSSNVVDEIRRYDGQTGAYIDTPVTGLDKARGLAFFEGGLYDGQLLIANRGTDEILRFDGTIVTPFVTTGSGGIDTPRSIAFGTDGNLYVTSAAASDVLKFSGTDGAPLGVFSSIGLASAIHIGFGTDGYLYATGRDTSVCCNTSLVRIDGTSGTVVETFALGRDGWSFVVGPDNIIYSSGNGNGNYVDRIGPASIASFDVSLSSAVGTPITVDFSSLDGTARVVDGDYAPTSGTITLEPGVTTRSIIVQSDDDLDIEGDETFSVTLSNAVGTTIADGTGIGTIVDNEVANVPPTVNAGADQTLSDGDGNGVAMATLTGSGSDSDGAIIGYQWTKGGTVLGNAASISPTLSVGTHTLTLTVTDNGGATASDSMVVTVNPNHGPTANAGSDQIVTDGTAVTLNGSGSDSDGSIVSYQWTEGATVLGNAASISPTLAVGAHTLTLTVTDNGGATASDTLMVTVNPIVVSSTKFYVVDTSVDDMFEYKEDGTLVENYNLGSGNNAPRGVAADITGNTMWVIDNDDSVYVHDNDGNLLRSWKASGLSRPEGIASNGTDIWIVDRGNDRVHYFAGGATRTTNTGATSSFSLVAGNPRGITSDGTHLWVVDTGTDDVYKYTTGGTFLGNWALDSRNTVPRGITIDPTNVNDIWVVDSTDDSVYKYSGAATRTSGSQSAAEVFRLAAGNTNPQGIADPPPDDALSSRVATAMSHHFGWAAGSALPPAMASDLFRVQETSSQRLTELPTVLDTWLGHNKRKSRAGLFEVTDKSKIDTALSSIQTSDDVAAEVTDSDFDGWLEILTNDLAEMLHRSAGLLT